MSDLKPKGVKIVLNGKEYGLRFTLNAIDDIQDRFNVPISNLGDLFQDDKNKIRNLRYLLTVLINEDIDCRKDETGEEIPHVDERFVGRHINAMNMPVMMNSIMKSFTAGTPEPDENDDIPNG